MENPQGSALLMGKIGERLMLARRRKSWTQKELGTQALVFHSQICQIERGERKHTSFIVIKRLADALDVSLDELAGRNGHADQP